MMIELSIVALGCMVGLYDTSSDEDGVNLDEGLGWWLR